MELSKKVIVTLGKKCLKLHRASSIFSSEERILHFVYCVIPSIFSIEVSAKDKNTDIISHRGKYSRTTTDSVGGRATQGQKTFIGTSEKKVVQ